MSAPDAATGAEVSEALVKFLQGQTPKSILAWAHVPE